MINGEPDTIFFTKAELEAWKKHREWSHVANKKKAEEIRWRKCKLGCSIGAVVTLSLATLASQIQEVEEAKEVEGGLLLRSLTSYSKPLFSIAGAVLVVLIPLVNEWYLSEKKIADRADSRVVGEELLSEIWKSLAGIPCYAQRDNTAADTLNGHIDGIIDANKSRQEINPMISLLQAEKVKILELLKGKEMIPTLGTDQSRKDLYMEKRVQHDLKRRFEKAKGAENLAKFWRNTENCFSGGSAFIVIILNSIKTEYTSLFGLLAVLFSSIATAVGSHITACRFDNNKKELYDVAILLDKLKEDRALNIQRQEETDEEWGKFVNSFEDMLLSQTRSWRSQTIEAARRNAEGEQQPENSRVLD